MKAGGKIEFVEAVNVDGYREQYERAQSLSVNVPGIEECSMKADDCETPEPGRAMSQFVDSNHNGTLEDGELALFLGSLNPPRKEEREPGVINVDAFALGSPFIKAGQPPGEPMAKLNIDFWRGSKNARKPSYIEIEKPIIQTDNGEVPACGIQGFKVADFDGDGDLDIGFELISAFTSATSLKIYLQPGKESIPMAEKPIAWYEAVLPWNWF